MARFYSNENFPLPVVERLCAFGHDVITSYDAGEANRAIADAAVLDFAVRNSRALLTLNRLHFIRLHRDRKDHAGIVVCTFDADFDALARRIHAAVTATPSLKGQLLRITRA